MKVGIELIASISTKMMLHRMALASGETPRFFVFMDYRNKKHLTKSIFYGIIYLFIFQIININARLHCCFAATSVFMFVTA